jgi:hypothetical protein
MIIPPSAIIPKQPDSYFKADIARRDLVILREEKRRSISRNIVVIIVLLLSPPFSQLPSQLLSQPPSQPLSQLFSQPLSPPPEPLESKIPVKYLDYEPKVPDLLNLTEPELNT